MLIYFCFDFTYKEITGRLESVIATGSSFPSRDKLEC